MSDTPQVAPQDWANRYARVVATEVRRYREQRGMSAQQVSDACARLGLPIHRSVISNFENGRRGNLSIGELFVIARALDVSPIFLMLPLGYEETVEILPGRTVDTTEAVEWVAGDSGRSWLGAQADLTAATLFQLRQLELLTLEELQQAAKLGLHMEGGYEAVAEEYARAQKQAELNQLEGERLRSEVERLEQATQQAPAPELLAARRRLADFEDSRERRLAELARVGERYLVAQQWKRSGGREAITNRLERVVNEIARRGMRPIAPELFNEISEEEE